MKFFDFCAGIGAGRRGLELAGMECVGYSEISRSSVASYKLLHNTDNEKNYGNLTKIDVNILPDFDLLIAGFPCQTFSVIGKKEGFNDIRGQLIFHIIDILKAKKIKYFILENVKGLTTHDKGNTLKIILRALDEAGYYVEHAVLNSMNYGVPQMRQRVYFVGIRKDLKLKNKKFVWGHQQKARQVEDILVSENNEISETDLKYFIDYLNNKTNQGKVTLDDILKKEYVVVDTRQSDLRLYYNRIPTLRSFRDGLYYVRNGKLRVLTGYEAMLIQGFSTEYAQKVDSVKDRDLLRQTGNAMTVGVIESIGKSLLDYLSNRVDKESASKNNTLVGVVKSVEQFKYCFDKKIYYTYSKTLTSPADDIRYVALYQTKSSFGFEQAGITYYGEVKKIYNVKRSQIHFNVDKTKQDKECVVFMVSEWKTLSTPILPAGNAKVLLLTTENKLKSASIYTDLCVI